MAKVISDHSSPKSAVAMAIVAIPVVPLLSASVQPVQDLFQMVDVFELLTIHQLLKSTEN